MDSTIISWSYDSVCPDTECNYSVGKEVPQCELCRSLRVSSLLCCLHVILPLNVCNGGASTVMQSVACDETSLLWTGYRLPHYS